MAKRANKTRKRRKSRPGSPSKQQGTHLRAKDQTPREADDTAKLRQLVEPHREGPAGLLARQQVNPPVVTRHAVEQILGVDDD